MICQKCKIAAATICVSQVINYHKVDIYLCSDCANESAAAGLKAALEFMQAFPGQLIFGGTNDHYFSVKKDNQCPTCQKTFLEISKDGKIGCANCYSFFREQLQPMVESIHGSAVHKGCCPSTVSDAYKTAQEIDQLKKLLEKAIEDEEYEKAADYRDLIKELEVKKDG